MFSAVGMYDGARGLRAVTWTALAVAGLLAVQDASAQEARTITFRDAVRIGLERNTTLRTARNVTALDATTVSQARAQFLPDLRWNAQGAENYGRSFSQSEGRILDQRTQTFNTGVSTGVTLFNGFANSATLREARLELDASEMSLERARQTVVFTVASNFLTLVQEREQLAVRRDALAAEEALERQINEYVEAGVRPIADLYQQQASVASARFTLVQAERASELAEVDLVQTLQLDPRVEYEFVPPDFGATLPSAPEHDLDELLRQAYAQRVDIEAEQNRVRAAEQGVRVARASRLPALSLNVGYNTAYTSAAELGFMDQLDQRRGGSVGLGVSLPVFDRASTRVASERARIALDNARLSAETRQQEVGVQVRRAYLDYQAARAQLAAAEAQQRAAELALETSRERYEVGAATLVELTQARATLTQAASALVSSRYNLLFQQTLMDYYVGTLDPARFTAGVSD
ncbi:MAG TPA: TolC family protein [Gemmatimonadaceae bacterium]